MLVSAVSLMGAFLVSWSNSSFAIQRLSIANATDSSINFIKESFIVEDAWFYQNSTGKYVNATIRNTGEIAVKISSIYVNNTQVWNKGKIIAMGDTATIDIALSWGADKSQSIWIKTDRGSEIKQVWKS